MMAFRDTSTKTRIETQVLPVPFVDEEELLEIHPLKQGLKLDKKNITE